MLADAQRLIAIDRELDIARQIQSSILPQAMPRVSGLTIATRYRPMTAVAGDFYDFLEMDAHRIGILVADVSGHGVPAALIASMVKVAFVAQREHADSPAAVLAGMNETLCGRLAGQYVTAAYLFVDIRAGVIRYGAAGHPPMLRLTHQEGRVDEVAQNGLLLGFIGDAGYNALEQPLRDHDRFLMLHRWPDRNRECSRRSFRARQGQGQSRRHGETASRRRYRQSVVDCRRVVRKTSG